MLQEMCKNHPDRVAVRFYSQSWRCQECVFTTWSRRSATWKGKKRSAENCEKLRAPKTAEHRANVSKARKVDFTHDQLREMFENHEISEPQFQRLIQFDLIEMGIDFTDCSGNSHGKFGPGHPDMIVHLDDGDMYVEVKSEWGSRSGLRDTQQKWFKKNADKNPIILRPSGFEFFKQLVTVKV